MKYLSPSETAKKWGITKARVIVLAKEGRISGVKRTGNNWLIPENALKPADRRHGKKNEFEYEHRFSLFMYGPYPDDELMAALSEDEKILLMAQLAHCRSEYEHCISLLMEIVNSIRNIYTKIGALYTLCLASAACNNQACFTSSLTQLSDIFSMDFPYKKDYAFIFFDIHSLYLGNEVLIKDFSVDPEYEYLPDIIPLIMLQTTYREMLLDIKQRRSDSPFHLEIVCNSYEHQCYHFVAQRLHQYIGLLYAGTHQKDAALIHFRKVIELGMRFEAYDIVSTCYLYTQRYYDEILTDYDTDLSEKIRHDSQIIASNIQAFIGSNAIYINRLLDLTEEERALMNYAVRKLSNKVISEMTGIPEYSVRRKYEKLFNKFNVQNKTKLGELFIELITAGYK